MSRIPWNLLLIVLAGLMGSAYGTTNGYTLEQQREDFSRARDALRNGQSAAYNKLLSKLSNYPLRGYLEYEELRSRLHKESDSKIRKFLQHNEDSPISDRLRSQWLYTLAQRGRWAMFLTEYREGSGDKVRCYYGQALFKRKRGDEAMEVAGELWLVGSSQPKECDPVFANWKLKGGMTTEMIWGRISRAVENGELSLARHLSKSLDETDRAWVERWCGIHSNPGHYLATQPELQVDQAVARRIVRHGVRRLARRDALAAMQVWEAVRAKHVSVADDAADVADVDRYIALQAVYQQQPKALEWLGALSNPDKNVRTWRVRAALMNKDWAAALSWLDTLPAEEKNEDQWRYWRARVMALQRPKDGSVHAAAERIYATLTNERTYHGFLAADRLGVGYYMTSEPLNYEKDELAKLATRPGIARAHELYRLGMLADARREWNYATASLSDRELRVAAALANRWGWHDRAILTVAKTEQWGDLDVRFPMAFREQITSHSGSQGVDPAWVYGVLRQESIFMVDARSHAGALGLMQIMPQTGRLTARLLKTKLRSPQELLDADNNIRLGVAYLKRLLELNKGNQVLATASYNAGPHRIKQWLPREPLDADLWVERIPFTETRRYVRRVLAYTVIFDYRLKGSATRIQHRMPAITPDRS